MSSTESISIGELARRTGKAPSAIRYYESIGLLPAPPRASGRRRYPANTARRLSRIDAAQRAGMTLDEVALLLDGAGGDQLRAVAERKLAELDALIEHTLRVRAWLEHARTCECGDLDKCPLFDDARPEARAG